MDRGGRRLRRRRSWRRRCSLRPVLARRPRAWPSSPPIAPSRTPAPLTEPLWSWSWHQSTDRPPERPWKVGPFWGAALCDFGGAPWWNGRSRLGPSARCGVWFSARRPITPRWVVHATYLGASAGVCRSDLGGEARGEALGGPATGNATVWVWGRCGEVGGRWN